MNNKKTKIFREQSTEKLPLRGNLYKKNQRRISFSKLFKLVFVCIAFISILFVSVYAIFLNNRTSAESINQATVLEHLSKNLVLPQEEVNSVMRVSNAKELSSQEEFYKDVKNGDYIIIFDKLVLIYDFDKSLIKNIKTY